MLSAEGTFPPARASIAEARSFAATTGAGLAPERRSSLVLMVSELATNCVRHAATEFVVRVDVTTAQITVRVTDAGPGVPELRSPAITDTSGRGLLVVERLSDEWGVASAFGRQGKTVWFTMGYGDERDAPEPMSLLSS